MGRRGRRERITRRLRRVPRRDGEPVLACRGAAERHGRGQEHAETMVEMWLRREGLDAARADAGHAGGAGQPRLAAAVARVAADQDGAVEDWLTAHDGVALRHRHASAALMRRSTRPVAPAPSTGEAPDGVPHLRHGRAASDRCRSCGGSAPAAVGSRHRFPVGVPLLDESHLQIDPRSRTARTEAERVGAAGRSGVAARGAAAAGRRATSGPGSCTLHVWDVGQLTGSLPGLYPLTRTGLLTVHDPGNLEGLLDELSDRIRRVHTRVLVGGHPSLQVLARGDAASGPSRGSSRCSSATARRWRRGAGPAGSTGRACLPGSRSCSRRPDDHRCAAGDGAAAVGGRRGTGHAAVADDHDDRPVTSPCARPAAAAARR